MQVKRTDVVIAADCGILPYAMSGIASSFVSVDLDELLCELIGAA